LVISRRGVIGSISKSKAHTMKYKKLGRTGLFVSEICLGTKHAYDVVDAIRPIAERHGVSVARAALAWLLHQKSVMSVICRRQNAGATRRQHRGGGAYVERRRSGGAG